MDTVTDLFVVLFYVIDFHRFICQFVRNCSHVSLLKAKLKVMYSC